MRRPKHQVTSGEDLFVGIDLHKIRWHVTIRTVDIELFSASIPGNWESLQRILARYAGHQLQAVYEAGYFGFRLHDRLVEHDIPCLVTPPSLVPQEYGNRVKTDRRDSSKLAHLLAKGLLKREWVPSEEELYHRRVRMGRITGIGKNTLRAILVEASWKLITKDQPMREKYERIKIRSGGKRAIVAVARTLLLRMRRMLLVGRAYALPLAA